MTTKQIAEAVGKEERTIRRWVKSVADKMTVVADKMSASSPMYPADYGLEETLAIIEHGMGKNAALLFRQSASQKAPETIAEIVKASIMALLPVIVAAVRGISPDSGPALPAPPLATRDELRRLVNQGAQAAGGYREAWGQLYTDMYYRLHRNVKECAKNRSMDTLDYVEEEGLLPDAIAIAREIFG